MNTLMVQVQIGVEWQSYGCFRSAGYVHGLNPARFTNRVMLKSAEKIKTLARSLVMY